MRSIMRKPARSRHGVLIAGLFLILAGQALRGVDPKFYPDDPLPREPETQDAAKVQEWDVILSFDLLQNLFSAPGDRRRIRAGNVNTIDEVADSSWFTNRIFARPITVDEAVRGPQTGPGPAAGPMTLVRPKSSGVSPGFVLRDSAGVTWFVQFDAKGFPEAATAAGMVANKIFHALGYWQTENYLASMRPEDIAVIDGGATVRTPSGRRRPFSRDDVAAVFARAHRASDGTYRMLASRALEGRPVGSFRYHGTRPDDPNDLVPHEHRRELRALRVFGAWTNLVDMKAGNTLDVVVTEQGRSVVRHYLQDVGSTFGTGALGPREWDEGHESLFDRGSTWRRLVTFGFFLQPWQTIPYTEYASVGRFEAEFFDPVKWQPRVPMPAFLNARADDNFWAARRVMAFSDELIRAMVRTGQYSDPAAEAHLADVLIARRNRIGRAFLPAVNPIVAPLIDAGGILTFRNAAVDAGVAGPPAAYQSTWFTFDNSTRESRQIGEAVSATTRIEAPVDLPAAPGAFIRVELGASAADHAAWAEPVQIYFRRAASGWTLVGFERLPDAE
jgi:hypothetical protein